MPDIEPALCLVTGATGYVGSRLVPALLRAGYRVRVMTRDRDRLATRSWRDRVEVAEGSADDPDAAAEALDGVDVGYYLVHSMDGSAGFAERDRATAQTFVDAADKGGVGRLVYLSGLYPPDEKLSEHLGSRRDVEQILLAAATPVAVLRAAVVVGSGSASFEMLRHLTERLPVMVAPRWLNNRIQPIAVRDVLHYLVGAAGLPADLDRGFDIGGPDILTYREMVNGYARCAGLPPRLIATLPVLTPWVASHWVGLVTPVPSGIAMPLVQSLVHEVVCQRDDIQQYVPAGEDGLLSYEEAVALALAPADQMDRRPEPVPERPSDVSAADPGWAGATTFTETRESTVWAPAATTWSVVEELGGRHGWYSTDAAWRVRGVIDRAVGGLGHPRRRSDGAIEAGDHLDSWEVLEVEPGSRITLRSRMRLPGEARLELSVRPGDDGTSVLTQRAWFRPSGLAGRVYWVSQLAAHKAVFALLQRDLARASANRATGRP